MNTESSPNPGVSPSSPPAPGRRGLRRAVVPLVFVGLVVAAGIVGWQFRHHVVAKNFAEVVPGKLYRSGALESGPLKRTLDRYQFRTIICLMRDGQADDPYLERERQAARDRGIRFVQIGMPGSGCGEFDDLERAAAILADDSAHPVLVHCYAGTNRTGAVVAVWRMKYGGWDIDRACEETKRYGKRNPKLEPHLRQYYQERILTSSRPAE